MRWTLLFLAFFAPFPLHAQSAEIRGRVVEFGSRTGIRGVTVELDGVARRATNDNGQFSFSGIPLGPHRLSFRLIGYQAHDVELTLRADTVLVVELDVAPVRLDTVEAVVRNITIRGHVRDPAQQIDIVDADVRIGAQKPTTTSVAGNFKVGKVPSHRPTEVEVRAVGYLPYSTVITASRDTTLRVDLTVDPLGQKFIERHMAKLELRGRGLPYSRLQYNQDQLLYRRGQTVLDFLKSQIGNRAQSVACIFVDDIDFSLMGSSILDSYLVEEVRRLEIYDRGTMVRFYTASHLQKNIGSSKDLPTIVLIKTPRGPICR